MTASELAQHYREVRARLMGPRPSLQIVRPLCWADREELLPDINTRPQSKIIQYVEPEVLDETEFPPVTVKAIALACSAFYGVRVSDIVGPRRHAKVTLARQVAMYLAREMTICSLPLIGRLLHKDHTTVIHAYQKIKLLLERDLELADEIACIKGMLGQ